MYAVNSLRGGDARAGEDAIDATVEPHQFVRDNDPADDLLVFAEERDVDELVIGVHERNPTGKTIFGSTAQEVLLKTSRPVAVVPLE
ncbi:universal stress protein [Haloplanus halobius]|uniref:universal stress protein n=1 Tax=Haloplanus halobius TaxID=2934938 RepID=UPI003CE46C9E